jgi:isoamylase
LAPVALGASPDADGTDFVVWSGVAERVELCLFAPDGTETDRLDLVGDVDEAGGWRVRVPGVGTGQRYGYRVHGPGDPARGLACDPAKLLLDPAARALEGEVRWTPELLAPGVDSAPDVPAASCWRHPPSPAPASRPRTPGASRWCTRRTSVHSPLATRW